MRTKKSIKNVLFALISNVLVIIVGLISQAFFLKILGKEFLGLNSLFTNIISMLSIAELGIGSAIVFHLYKPLYENDKETIKSLIEFYKRAYHIIAIIIFIVGILLMPFLNKIVQVKSINVNIYIVFILFLLDSCLSYLLSYKRSIIYANQSNYIINIIHIIVFTFMNFMQIFFLIYTKNYYLYLIIKNMFRFLENYIINYIANKKYPYIKEKPIKKLDNSILEDIKKKVKALIVHQIGSFCVNGTDNLIISKFLGLSVVGFYSNYYLIINSINNLFSQSFSAITSSVGNLLVSDDKNKSIKIFHQLNLINFWISSFTMICLFILMDDFICVWIGSEFLLSKNILLILCINYFLQTMKRSITVFKEAGGIFYEDRYVPFIESGVNLIASIILVKFLGLIGVFIGTMLSVFVLHFYSYPKYIYKNLLGGNPSSYRFLIVKRLFLALILLLITFSVSLLANQVSTLIIRIVIKFLICIIIPNISILLIYFNNKDFKSIIVMLKRLLKRGEYK